LFKVHGLKAQLRFYFLVLGVYPSMISSSYFNWITYLSSRLFGVYRTYFLIISRTKLRHFG